MFALSAVASRADQTYSKIKMVVKEVIETFGTKKLRYAVIIYGRTPTVEVTFNEQYPDVSSLKRIVDSLPRKSGGPELHQALVQVRNLFGKSRPKAHKVLVIVTDKRSSSSDQDIRKAVDDLERKNVKIITLGIGKEVDIPRLDKLSPKSNDTISAKGDEDPKKLGQEIVKKILGGTVELYFSTLSNLSL